MTPPAASFSIVLSLCGHRLPVVGDTATESTIDANRVFAQTGLGVVSEAE